LGLLNKKLAKKKWKIGFENVRKTIPLFGLII